MTFRKWRIYLLNKSQAFACSYLNWRKRFMLENLKIPTEKSANKRWPWMLNICRTSINSVNANNNMYIYECVTQRQYSSYIAADECWLNRRWSLECPQTQESKCYQLVGAQTKISGVAASERGRDECVDFCVDYMTTVMAGRAGGLWGWTEQRKRANTLWKCAAELQWLKSMINSPSHKRREQSRLDIF